MTDLRHVSQATALSVQPEVSIQYRWFSESLMRSAASSSQYASPVTSALAERSGASCGLQRNVHE